MSSPSHGTHVAHEPALPTHLGSNLRIFAAVVVMVLLGMITFIVTPAAARDSDGQVDVEAILEDLTTSIRARGSSSWCFEQQTYNASLGDTTIEKGHLFLTVPGRMRWAYESGKTLVARDDEVALYVPSDHTAYVGSASTLDSSQSGLLMLSGERNLDELFTVDRVQEGDPPEQTSDGSSVITLQLTDRSEASGQPMRIRIQKGDTPTLEAFQIRDAYGNRTTLELSSCMPSDQGGATGEDRYRLKIPPSTTIRDFGGETTEAVPDFVIRSES